MAQDVGRAGQDSESAVRKRKDASRQRAEGRQVAAPGEQRWTRTLFSDLDQRSHLINDLVDH